VSFTPFGTYSCKGCLLKENEIPMLHMKLGKW
jgi:hypothetical protein